MGIVNGINIVNNLIAGSMSGAQLQTYLATGGNRASFVQVVNVRRQLQVLRNTPAAVTAVTASTSAVEVIANNDTAVRQWLLYGTNYNWRSFTSLGAVLASAPAMAEIAANAAATSLLAASPTALAKVAASSTAMNALVSNTAVMAAVAASATAMASVVASSTTMSAIAESSTAKMAIFNSDVALDAVKASATAMAALRVATQYTVVSHAGTGGAVAIPANAAGSYILLGFSNATNAAAGTVSLINTRRAGSAQPNSALASPGGTAVNAQKVNMALPLVSPFTAASATGGTWYYGMLRCDV